MGGVVTLILYTRARLSVHDLHPTRSLPAGYSVFTSPYFSQMHSDSPDEQDLETTSNFYFTLNYFPEYLTSSTS